MHMQALYFLPTSIHTWLSNRHWPEHPKTGTFSRLAQLRTLFFQLGQSSWNSLFSPTHLIH